ncbi:uncharacterized protein KGF55_000555 [Candida pseudojiufengensis]|uniref:uncharacterized protein n=1 Tax=Candida pseudojiufengensis TaxID=497109 RepID=UPI002224E2AB|nr:uncharacterized protein KGF55_000555 [Candida pseudojiufengensis]KAI5966246.1 hypothetical protein KGF55_000555 [Candida pseudojiufengensis]
MTSVWNGNSNENERLVSHRLFDKLKPFCIQLSQEVLQPQINESKITSLLTSIVNEMEFESKVATNTEIHFKILPNVADYIFFPISNLLKQSNLNDAITQKILILIGLLIQHCWSYNVNYTLFDQLFSLVLFLSGASNSGSASEIIKEKSIQFQSSTIFVLSQLINSLSKLYFEEKNNRLHFLSSTITLSLDVITSTSSNDQESITLLSQTFELIRSSLLRLNEDQVSIILPGIVSSLAKFTSSNSNINYQLLIQILRLLTYIVTSSFSDDALGSELIVPEIHSLTEIDVVWDDDERTLDGSPQSSDEIRITERDHRNIAWLRATSKQLKITLVTIFKSVLLNSRNRQRWQTRSDLYDTVVNFNTSVLKNCFIALYNEIPPLTLDICSILLYSSSYDEQLDFKIWQLASLVDDAINDNETKSKAYFELVRKKLSSLINNKLSVIVFSTDEDKISMNLIALKFHFAVLMELSRKLDRQFQELNILKHDCLKLLIELTIDHAKISNSSRSLKSSKNSLQITTGNENSNTMDNIELPSYINAKSVKAQHGDNNRQRDFNTHNILTLSRQWSKGPPLTTERIAVGIGSTYLEGKLKNLISFISELKSNQTGTDLEEIESLLDDFDEDTISKGVSLWFATNLAKNGLSKSMSLDVSEFLNIEEPMEVDSEENEVSFLLLVKSLELLNNLNVSELSNIENGQLANQISIISSLETISTVAGTISIDEFRSNVLMDHLLSILQALTFTDKPNIQLQAQKTIQDIVDIYYKGSIQAMIMDNSDYLVDAISLQMSVASNLTPTLPGILMVIVRIAGIQLLETNQLTDILSDMFVILDSYHGYNKLVESFFVVFEALVDQIQNLYLKLSNVLKVENKIENVSQFKPWGMTNKAQLLELLSDKKTIDPMEEYDSNKEYFKRPADKPFSEIGNDSDDEEDNEGTEIQEEEEKWTSPIPKEIYIVLKRIFNYGFVLISQPSFTLKSQIMKTLRLLLPLLCTNYKLLLPMIVSNWPILTTLISGVDSLSTTSRENNSFSREKINLTIESLEFVIEIIQQDFLQGEYFFSRKFQDTWNFVSNHSDLVKNESQTVSEVVSKEIAISEKAIYTLRMSPKLREKLVEFLLTGAQVYEKSIPDVIRYSIIKLCYKLQIPPRFPISRDTLCILEVLKTNVVH